MDERVHRYLDGELEEAELTAADRQTAREFQRTLDVLRADGERLHSCDLASGVMRRVAAKAPDQPGRDVDRRSAPHRPWTWIFRPRTVTLTLRPVQVAAAAVVLLLAISWGMVSDFGRGSAAAPEPTVFVRFELEAPEASSVRLAGSFSGWSADVALRRGGDGTWRALVPLKPGVHDYAFQVDGERWTVDPRAPRVADGFGGYNSRLSLVVANS